MNIENLLKLINTILPAQTAMEGDRIGLQVQSGRQNISNILVALELNDEVIAEAEKNNKDCIVSFHPLIFSPLTSIQENDRVGNLCTKLIQNSISLIAIHTNFDSFIEGTSKILADKLGLITDDFIAPDVEIEGFGMGVMAHPEKPIRAGELLERVYKTCNSPLRFCEGREGKEIESIAIVGGSGTSFINNVLRKNADAFITADVTYHKFHSVKGRLMLIDPGHYEMEQFVPFGLAKLLNEKINKNEMDSISISGVVTNPVKYYPDTENYINSQKQILINKN